MRQRLYIFLSLWKVTCSVLLAVLCVEDFDFTITFPDLSTSSTDDVISDVIVDGSEADVMTATQLHLLRYGALYLCFISSILCTYMAGLACKLNMQVMI